MVLAGQSYSGRYDEDVGSTLFFDRAALKRIADAQSREAAELSLKQADEEALVCVTSKRIRLEPARPPAAPRT